MYFNHTIHVLDNPVKPERRKYEHGVFFELSFLEKHTRSLCGVTLLFDNKNWEEFKTKMREVLDDDDGTTEVVGAGREGEGAGEPAQENKD